MKLTDDEFEYLLESALHCIGRVDGVAYSEAVRIAGFIMKKTGLEPDVETTIGARLALADLVYSLGWWYRGVDYSQRALDAAATLATIIDAELDEYSRPAHQTLWKD